MSPALARASKASPPSITLPCMQVPELLSSSSSFSSLYCSPPCILLPLLLPLLPLLGSYYHRSDTLSRRDREGQVATIHPSLQHSLPPAETGRQAGEVACRGGKGALGVLPSSSAAPPPFTHTHTQASVCANACLIDCCSCSCSLLLRLYFYGCCLLAHTHTHTTAAASLTHSPTHTLVENAILVSCGAFTGSLEGSSGGWGGVSGVGERQHHCLPTSIAPPSPPAAACFSLSEPSASLLALALPAHAVIEQRESSYSWSSRVASSCDSSSVLVMRGESMVSG